MPGLNLPPVISCQQVLSSWDTPWTSQNRPLTQPSVTHAGSSDQTSSSRMGTASLAVLGALLIVVQNPTVFSAPQDGLNQMRKTMQDEVSVIHFPKTTKGLSREKREWVIPEINIVENDRGLFPKKASQSDFFPWEEQLNGWSPPSLHEDTVLADADSSSKLNMILFGLDTFQRFWKNQNRTIYYSITGPGADQPPMNLFTVGRTTGIMYVTQPLDREATESYELLVHATSQDGTPLEYPVEIKIVVIDVNDNRPAFLLQEYTGEVSQFSPIGLEILKVTAEDLDKKESANSDVRYGILNQEPNSPSDTMFAINPVSGSIRVNSAGLDKEKTPEFTLEIQAADLEGEGLASTTKVLLKVTDYALVSTETEATLSFLTEGEGVVLV